MQGQDGASTLMSIRDAARASGLSPKALRRRIERGTLRSVLVGGRRRIPVDDLVRRGLMAGPDDPARVAGRMREEDEEQIAGRLQSLESRVAALEAMLAAATAPRDPSPEDRPPASRTAMTPPARAGMRPAR